jgi:hypothetical protein
MIKDNKPGSISPYRVIQLKQGQNSSNFKPQIHQLNKIESQKKKSDEKIKEMTKLSEADPKTRGSTDIVVLMADVMGISVPLNVLDVPKQMKIETNPNSNWDDTRLGYRLDQKNSKESSIFGSIGGKTKNDNFSMSTGVFTKAGDLANRQLLPQTTLDISADLKDGTSFNGDASFNLNNQNGFAKFELDGSKKFSLFNYEKPGFQKLGKFHFETFSKDLDEMTKFDLKNPKSKEKPLIYEKYFTSDVDLDQRKTSINYGTHNFQLGASSVFNKNEKSGLVQTKYLFMDQKGLMTFDGAFAEKNILDKDKKVYKSHQGSASFGLNLPTTTVNTATTFESSPLNSDLNSNFNLNQRFGKNMRSSFSQSNMIKLHESSEKNLKSFNSSTTLNLQQSDVIKFLITNSDSHGELKAPIDPTNPKTGSQVVGTQSEKKEKYELTHNAFRINTDLATNVGYERSSQIKNLKNGNVIIDNNHVISGSFGVNRNLGTRSAILVTTGGKGSHHA